ncbi:enoyl-CoA-hydratase DpgB [Streptomyces sp. NPDC021096]|uniref:enoyl-CoA-hydratase DpgB n=1 Tax=Streptomyces sp. NPDC021096 TaxID=3154792 RepID=UPI0033CC1889
MTEQRGNEKLNPTGISPRPAEDFTIRVDGARPLTVATVAELTALADRVEDSGAPQVAVLHVTGAPEDSWTREVSLPLVNKWERALRRLERLDAATVAVATGDCGGVAFEALLATDYRIAGADARLTVPSDVNGVWPGMALYRLANQIGIGPTRRTVLFGLPLPASEALGLHLVDEVADDTEAALARTVALLGSRTGQGLGVRRQLMLDATTTRFEDALGSHLAACDRVLRRVPAEVAP